MKNVFKMDVSKTVGNKKEKVGNVDVPFPSLRELGIDVDPVKVNEDGTLEYATDLHNFLQGAVLERVKGMARNKMISGSTELKPGCVIAADLDTLTKPVSAGGNAETLKAISELKKAFAEYLATLGLSSKAQAALASIFAKPAGLAYQSAGMREKVQARVEGFVAWLEDQPQHEVTAAGEAYLGRVLDACAESEELDLDDF